MEDNPRGVTQKSVCMTLVTHAQYGGNGVETQIGFSGLGIAIHLKSNLQYRQFHSVVYSIFSLKYSIEDT